MIKLCYNHWKLGLIFQNDHFCLNRGDLGLKHLEKVKVPEKHYSIVVSIEIAEIWLKFLNINKISNQQTIKLSLKYIDTTETYDIYDTEHKKLNLKYAIYG